MPNANIRGISNQSSAPRNTSAILIYCHYILGKIVMNIISKKKLPYLIAPALKQYLTEYGRYKYLPCKYEELFRFMEMIPILDKDGNDTLWANCVYSHSNAEEIFKNLVTIYAILKGHIDQSGMDHLYIERVDFCTFGNSKPFRVRVVNQYNDNHDHFYVKVADASRIYGLEVEDILSPNQIHYLVDGNTLIEEHIAGIPGDIFLKNNLQNNQVNRVRLAKEFVKFNERCFVRLLGDMRPYNYVIVETPDFEESQYRVRAIDFDQQSYEGKTTVYLSQFFQGNAQVVQLCSEMLNPKTIRQYQMEERALMSRRLRFSDSKINSLMVAMRGDELSPPEKVQELKEGLGKFHKTRRFESCTTMGDILWMNIEILLEIQRA